MKIIHLSDLHIGKSSNHHKTSRIVDWILENQEAHQAEAVVISGDLVDDGALWQFHRAQKLLDRLEEAGLPVLVVPGNHDYGMMGIAESRDSQAWFAELIAGFDNYPHLEILDGQAFVLLDSMGQEIENIEFWGAQGMLGRRQLQELDRMLDELKANPAVQTITVVMHHHPFDFAYFHGLRDHADLKSMITRPVDEEPRVNCLLFGHKHIEKRFNDPDENKEKLYGINLIYSAGSAVERNEEGKMSVAVIDLDYFTIEHYSLR